MKIHREGRIIIPITFILLLVLTVLLHKFFQPLVAAGMLLPFVVITFLVIWFFRIPVRKVIASADKVIAPADGKIVVIEKTTETEYLKRECIQVSIFMSPLNVHQNVYPLSGTVCYTQYHKGKYLVAWHPKSSTENERSTVVVKTASGTEVLFRQIAGAVARRICTYAKVGDKAERGEEFGFIKFGSRVDIFLPTDARILCKVGDISKNKLTVLAELK